MRKLKECTKIIGTFVVEQLLKIFWLMPIKKNQIMFISYTGNYSDSPKYIYKAMICSDSSFEYVWAVNNSSKTEDEIRDCKKVQFGTMAYYIAICTSRIVVANNFLNTFIPRRSGQEIINTWHGGSPLKTVGMVSDNISRFDRFFYKEHAKKYSYFLSSSKFMTEEVIKKSFGYNGIVYNCGLPRNSVLFRDSKCVKEKVSKWFNISIDENNGIILYAPTFRGGAKNAGFISKEQQFDIEECIRSMERRFGKQFKLLFRAHYFKDNIPANCLMASEYPDMQELLIAADVLITDYSSCMGDMCLMFKPTFLYTPDLKEYKDKSGFYWDIFSLPFPIAECQDAFYESIKQFDEEKYIDGVKNYLKRLGSYEGPDTDIKVSELIKSLVLKGSKNV